MKIVQINIFPNLSTGNIMNNIHKKLLEEGIDSYIVWGRGRKSNNKREIFLNDKIGVYYHVLYTRFTDKTGFASKRATKKLLKKLDEIKPDIIHLHNIHGYYINIEMLFNYIKENNIKVVWTLHDCWAFTGHCAYFDKAHCEKWKTECDKCKFSHEYPKSYINNAKWNYNKKKEMFTGLNMTIVTPSKWLGNLVKQSFLKDYEVKIINNGIDTKIFNKKNSTFKTKHNIEDKKMILGVASTWSERKGYEDFIKLSKVIDDNTVIVMIGLNKKQLKNLPKNIIGFGRTKTIEELVDAYNAADIYYNPTYEDNYPTTNIEALACGTPVITYNTGGSPECIEHENGIVTNLEDFCKNYKVNIKYEIKDNKKYSIEKMFNEYIELYNNIFTESRK